MLTLELGGTILFGVHIWKKLLLWTEVLAGKYDMLLVVVPVSTEDW